MSAKKPWSDSKVIIIEKNEREMNLHADKIWAKKVSIDNNNMVVRLMGRLFENHVYAYISVCTHGNLNI